MRGIGAASIILFNYVVSHSLGNSAGHLLWSFAGLIIASQFLMFGFNEVALKHVSEAFHSHDLARANTTVKLILRVISIPCLVALFAIAACSRQVSEWFFPGASGTSQLFLFFSPGIIFLSLSQIIAFALQGAGMASKSIFSMSIGPYLFASVLIVALDISEASHAAAAFSLAAGLNLFLALSWWFRATSSRTYPRTIEKPNLWPMAAPVWITTVMSAIITWGGQFFAAIWLSPEEVAQYAISLRVVAVVNFLLVAMSFVVAPRIAQLYKFGNISELQELTSRCIGLLYLFVIPLTLLFIIFSDFILALFSISGTKSQLVVAILVAGQLANVLTGPANYLLTMTGNEVVLRNIYVVSAALSISLVFLLAPRYGLIGSSLAASFAIIFQNVAAAIAVKARVGVYTLPFYRTSQNFRNES